MKRRPLPALLAVTILSACAQMPAQPTSSAHLQDTATIGASSPPIPEPVSQTFSLPAPKPAPKLETYSVVVSNVPVQELLFALARDAKINIDVHPGLQGFVTLNAIDQTLPQLMARISQQVDLRYEIKDGNLAVMPDTPFLRTYHVDYVLMNRDTTSTVSVATQIASAGIAGGTSAGSGNVGASAATGNSSLTEIRNTAKNHFWETLIENIKDILRETDKLVPEGGEGQAEGPTGAPKPANPAPALVEPTQNGARVNLAVNLTPAAASVPNRTFYREAASVTAHPETGIITVRATGRQHERVREFIDQVQRAATRQVLIEATVLEVSLSRNYQQGIDWSKINLGGSGFRLVQRAAGNIAAPTSSIFELAYTSSGGSFNGSIKLLESFGDVRVLSSPKLSVLNNQSAVLKVVDNAVYFTVESDTNQNQNQTLTTFTTTVHSVPIGFVMNVTPQVSENDTVLLNLRPSLSRIIGQATDPNPALKLQGIVNNIPIIRSREIESVIRVSNGNIAVMGGLMEDLRNDKDDSVPLLSRIPIAGELFINRDDTTTKTELVIFLRPTVIREASINGDYRGFRDQLPRSDFFSRDSIPSNPNLGGAAIEPLAPAQ